MTKKKSRFLTFIFSLMPGAGEMYMGFMKRGLSIMSMFFLFILSSTWLNIGPIIYVLPIIWFYSFFSVNNICSLPDEEFYALEDDFIFDIDKGKESSKLFVKKYRNFVALALILFGTSILWNNISSILRIVLPAFIYEFTHQVGYYLPQLIIGIAIISLGVQLIRGKKIELEKSDQNDIGEAK